jgi:hypothetical protein
VSIGWTCRVLGPLGDVELEQLDAAGAEWFGEGPGGTAAGTMETVLAACAGDDADPEWIDAVANAIEREVAVGLRRSMLLVKRGEGWMFHASRSSNRESIARHGLDWGRMTEAGIAGSTQAEWPGVFLCAELESARWFAQMARPGPADIWRVRVDGLWLEGDPGASGGGDDDWMIAAGPIPAEDVALLERDV